MYKLIQQYHNFILTGAKIAVSISAFYYIWHQAFIFKTFVIPIDFFNLQTIFVLLTFSLINWGLEIKKWQFLAGHIQKTGLWDAARQSLTSFSISLLTPNRVGEYGAKILYFKKKDYVKATGLVLIGNLSQLSVSIIFGLIAIVYWFNTGLIYRLKGMNSFLENGQNKVWILIVLIIGLSLLLWLYYTKYNQNLLKISFISLVFAILRYLFFSTQFVWLLHYFKAPQHLFLLYSGVWLVYFIASLIPILAFLDWVVKGSVAIMIFSILHLQTTIIFQIVSIMWLYNFLLPFLIGLLWLWQQKIPLKKETL